MPLGLNPCYTPPVPTQSRLGKNRSPRRGGSKKREDAQLITLMSLVFILFALLVSLILGTRIARGKDSAASGSAELETPAPSAIVELPDPSARAEAPQEELLSRREDERPPKPSPSPSREASTQPRASPERLATQTPKKPQEKGGRVGAAVPEHRPKGEICIVIDDVGQNLWQLKPFLKFPGPICFAILPGLPYTQEARDLIQAAGKDYILHQPMQAMDKLNPGPGALYLNMEDEKIWDTLEKNFTELPGAKGMNNHMGSLATKDLRIMRQVLRFAKSRDIAFLDSRTIGGTATAEAARLEEAAYGERDVFLDNSPEKENIVTMFKEGQKISEKHGRAVMIGHVWSAELAQTLMDLYPELINEGYSLSSISKIMIGEDDADPWD